MFVIKSEFVSNIGNLTLFLLLIKDNEPAVPKNFFSLIICILVLRFFLFFKNFMILLPKYFIDIIKLSKPCS